MTLTDADCTVVVHLSTNHRRSICQRIRCYVSEVMIQIPLTTDADAVSPRFYVQMGLGAMSFTYTVISAACGLVSVLCGLYLYAHLGRRPILITGAFLQIPFMCLVAGLGGKKNHSTTDIHMVIASIILFSCFEKISLSTSCYIITSEIGGTRMRKKSKNIWRSCGLHMLTVSQ